uniref:Uncharacterized protein n=1 Tax=Astyanax mexicanus TaxID=7994 RepID=A0A3B1K0J9_ASTMX
MISGHPMELMDGDAAHVPLVWVSAVLDKVIRKLGDQRVFVLSVLGIRGAQGIHHAQRHVRTPSLNPEDQISIRELISKVIQQTTKKVNSFPVSVQGYSSVYIQEIVRDVKQLVQEFKPRHDSFEFKKEFFVDLSLYVCEQAEKRFVELHRKYREANDPLLHFKMKKADNINYLIHIQTSTLHLI